MYALFLETQAAAQIDRYVVTHGGDADAIKQACYNNTFEQGKTVHYFKGKTQEEFDSWWVNKCLEGDYHKQYDVDSLFTWSHTPEGHGYWASISVE